jgi:hypothetical protein
MAAMLIRRSMRGAWWAALVLLVSACATPPPGAGRLAQQAELPDRSVDQPAETSLPVDSLLYERASAVRARFGDPHAQRRDGGAVVWNYEADGLCRLNLVLQGVRGAPQQVVHAQARLSEGGTEAVCLERLRQEARVSSVAPEPEPVATPVQVQRPRAATRPAPRPAAVVRRGR